MRGWRGGYDLAAGAFVIRPYAGVGAVGTNATVPLPAMGVFAGSKTSASDSRFAVWPGAALLFPFEEAAAFVGVDAKFLIVDAANAFNAYGTFRTGVLNGGAMKANREPSMRESAPPRASPHTQWSILDRSTGHSRVVAPDEWFPVSGRLLSAVWELDDGRVLMPSSIEDEGDTSSSNGG